MSGRCSHIEMLLKSDIGNFERGNLRIISNIVCSPSYSGIGFTFRPQREGR
jgi:hypothetical protein